ncbi:MAG: hypothetical protein JXB62_21985 [Pirellulales bacterium]|nr:hypothetical protein [Pirellulales bacterium]
MRNRSVKRRQDSRRGATLLLAMLLAVGMLGVIALAVDVGHMVLARTQLQVSADSAAMAAAAANMSEPWNQVLATATQYANYHQAGGKPVDLQPNDVESGIWNAELRRFMPSSYATNAVRVTTRRDQNSGGTSPLFFARIFGPDGCNLRTEAVAAYADNFSGFTPHEGGNLPILPIAVPIDTWKDLMEQRGDDKWTVDPSSHEVSLGWDGKTELSIYPQNSGSADQNGLISIGGKKGTKALGQQIVDGVSPKDLEPFGGSLKLGPDGTLKLDGVPGLHAGLKHYLSDILGQPRIIPLYASLEGRSHGAEYTIVQFAAVTLVEVDLTGSKHSNKRVVVQPTSLVTHDGIPSDAPDPQSYSIFSPVRLVR